MDIEQYEPELDEEKQAKDYKLVRTPMDSLEVVGSYLVYGN